MDSSRPGAPEEPQPLETELQKIEVAGVQDGYRLIRLTTSRGIVQTRFYESPGSTSAVIWAGASVGGFDSPARGLYPRLARELLAEQVSSLQVRYRQPTNLQESVLDVLAGLGFLQVVGVDSVTLVGHSFGGAVAIWAGTLSPLVRAVATLATQSYGTGVAGRLAPRPLLLIHGSADEVLEPEASSLVYERAQPPREIKLYTGAGHALDEVADELALHLRGWLLRSLGNDGDLAGPLAA